MGIGRSYTDKIWARSGFSNTEAYPPNSFRTWHISKTDDSGQNKFDASYLNYTKLKLESFENRNEFSESTEQFGDLTMSVLQYIETKVWLIWPVSWRTSDIFTRFGDLRQNSGHNSRLCINMENFAIESCYGEMYKTIIVYRACFLFFNPSLAISGSIPIDSFQNYLGESGHQFSLITRVNPKFSYGAPLSIIGEADVLMIVTVSISFRVMISKKLEHYS